MGEPLRCRGFPGYTPTGKQATRWRGLSKSCVSEQEKQVASLGINCSLPDSPYPLSCSSPV